MESARAQAEDYAWMRRLQLAAQAGNAMAVLYRSPAAERLSTPAHLRVVVSREQGALMIRIPKRRGPPLQKAIACFGSASNSQPSRSSSSNVLALVPLRS
jgi:hypothetical protein